MKKLLMIIVLMLSTNLFAVPSDNNPGNAGGEGNHYGWDEKSKAVPELDPGLLIGALVVLACGTFIIVSRKKKKNDENNQGD